MDKYAELHCHSAFSLLDGASNPEELVEYAKTIGLNALALTDHDDMGGAVRFAHRASELDLPAIIGIELTLEDDSHLTLLAKDLNGYKNLCTLVSQSRLSCSRGSPRTSYQTLSKHTNGLIALSGCPKGKIAGLLAQGKNLEAKETLKNLYEIFSDNLFLELWDHHLPQEAMICKELFELSNSFSIPWLVTNNIHYATPDKRIIHDVLTCLKHGVTLNTAGRRLRPNGSWHLKSAAEMTHQWRNNLNGLKNTLLVAERCEFRLKKIEPVLPKCNVPDGISYNDYLTKLVWQGAHDRYGSNLTEKHIKQIEHELAVITKMDMAPFFLIMHEIIEFANSQGILVQGRGSAANSAVCYCLKITAVDPIGMKLLFERFISEGRGEPPDIDLDIGHDDREIVIQHVYNKYGRNYAAMVCEHITYRGKSAIRDVARVFDLSIEQGNKLAQEGDAREAQQAALVLANGGAQKAGLDPKDRRVQLLIKTIAGLHQLPRHRSIHVGGFVLSGEPIGEIVPTEPASMPNRTIIQWDKDDLDLIGLIKIDLLGLGILTVLKNSQKLVKQHRHKDIDLAKLPMNDEAVYGMLQKADTVGLFQVESRAQMSILPKLCPKNFYDIVISLSLVRPGPIQGGIIRPYLRRRKNLEPITYLHSSFKPILERTLGVPLFQEQGMRLAVEAANFTPAQANELRCAMTHKRSHERMAQLSIVLKEGMKKNGLSDDAIETITHQLKAFANYGFPESHSASFALLAYASAYLKQYFAPEFYCAMLNAQPVGFYSSDTLIRDAMHHNVEVLPVDLAKSNWDCTLENREPLDPMLRIGLRYINGLGHKAKLKLEQAWQQGPFISLADVVKRSHLRTKDLERLAHAGAFSSFEQDRRQALWKVLSLCNQKRENLLGLTTKNSKSYLPTMTSLDQTIADYQSSGLSAGNHPMFYIRSQMTKQGIVSSNMLSNLPHNVFITVAGGVICRQRPQSAKGFVFITLEDETGMSNIIIKPKLFQQQKDIIIDNTFLIIFGQLQKDEGAINIIAKKTKPLPQFSNEDKLHLSSHNFH